MQPDYVRCHEEGPAAGTAADVETLGMGGERIPVKDSEGVAKHPFGFAGGAMPS